MQTTNTEAILAQLHALIPGATTVDKVSMSREKRDTLDEARAKVAKKLRDNVAYFNGTGQKVDLVYKVRPGPKYAVGIKYGNRYLIGAIAGGTYVLDVSAELLPKVLEMFATQVEAGLYDYAIEKVRQANVEARNSVKH